MSSLCVARKGGGRRTELVSCLIQVAQQGATVSSVQGYGAPQGLLSFPSSLIVKGRLGPTVSVHGTVACHCLVAYRKKGLSSLTLFAAVDGAWACTVVLEASLGVG